MATQGWQRPTTLPGAVRRAGSHFLCSELRSRFLRASRAAGGEGRAAPRGQAADASSQPKTQVGGHLPSTPGHVDARCQRSPLGSARSPQCDVLGDIQTCSRAGAGTVSLQALCLVGSPGLWSKHEARQHLKWQL